MKFKVGNLLFSNTTSFIVAVLGVVLLFLAGVRIYGLFASNDAEKAQSLMNDLNDHILALNEGQETHYYAQGLNDWFLVAWSKDERGPDKCFFSSCTCICPHANAVSCQEAGFCRTYDVNETQVLAVGRKVVCPAGAESCTIPSLTSFESVSENENLPCVVLSSQLFDITLLKNESKITLKTQIAKEEISLNSQETRCFGR